MTSPSSRSTSPEEDKDGDTKTPIVKSEVAEPPASQPRTITLKLRYRGQYWTPKDPTDPRSRAASRSSSLGPRKIPVSPHDSKLVLHQECRKRRLPVTGKKLDLSNRINIFDSAFAPHAYMALDVYYPDFQRRHMQELLLPKSMEELRGLCNHFELGAFGWRFELVGRLVDFYRRLGVRELRKRGEVPEGLGDGEVTPRSEWTPLPSIEDE